MRFSTVAIASAIVAVASAQDLDPNYPFLPNGACVDACLTKVGKSMFAGFTNDPTSPDFMASLAFAHERDTPAYKTYMSQTGMCIMNCDMSEQDLYNAQYKAKAAWYADKKAGGTGSGNATTTAPPTSTTTTPSGAVANSASALVGVVAVLCTIALL
ncbi:hypothetical protein EC957_000185 [Mortierella hygrophila]|uniref:Secreted protein n=1 Tax=Mortierella hygrophila TaxID=979708 RepID=A0A9P6FG58_9FUNG|nr:hypothetical protein EC957_000185 [Mortierella hygrophila]